jgi:hypothetical protein
MSIPSRAAARLTLLGKPKTGKHGHDFLAHRQFW